MSDIHGVTATANTISAQCHVLLAVVIDLRQKRARAHVCVCVCVAAHVAGPDSMRTTLVARPRRCSRVVCCTRGATNLLRV